MGFVLTHPISAGSGIPGLTTTIINSQPMLTLEDTTRANKILSIAEQTLVFAENRLSDLDWVRIGTSNHANSGYIADFDGTITCISAHCENTGGGNSKDLHLFIGSSVTSVGILGTLGGGVNAIINDTTLNFDVSQGDRIRIQAQDGSGGNIQDTNIKLILKWRG